MLAPFVKQVRRSYIIDGPTLKKIREAAKISRGEFSDRVGITDVFLWQLERGRRQSVSEMTYKAFVQVLEEMKK